MSRTFYQVLGVPPTADPQEIKVAYRARVRKVHPDLYRDRPPEERVQFEAEVRSLNEAYSVLSSLDRRGLYDRALAEGFDFYEAEENSRPETEAEREVREAADRLMEEGRLRAVEATAQHVQALLPRAKWGREPLTDPYFDLLLIGHHGPSRLKVWIKIFHQLRAEDLPGVENFAEASLRLVPGGLIREQHSYLLLGRQIDGTVQVFSEMERFNYRCWAGVKGRAPRACMAYGDLRDGRVHSPGVPDPEPRLADLRLDLKGYFRL